MQPKYKYLPEAINFITGEEFTPEEVESNWILGFLSHTSNSEAPTIYRLWMALGILSAVVNRKSWIMLNKPIYPNFYIILLGTAGCKKGTAIDLAKPFLEATNIAQSSRSFSLRGFMRDLYESRVTCKLPDNTSYVYSAMVAVVEELRVAIDAPEKVVNLLDLFDCPALADHSIKSEEDKMGIVNPFLTLIGATTIEQFKNSGGGGSTGTDLTENGFISRAILPYAQLSDTRLVHFPDHYTPKRLAEQSLLIKRLKHIGRMIMGEYNRTPAFEEKYIAWREYTHHKLGFFYAGTPFESFYNRAPLHLTKIAMLVSAATRADMLVTGDDFDMAYDIFGILISRLNLVYRMMGANLLNPLIMRMTEMIKKSEKPIGTEDFISQLYYNNSTEDIHNACVILAALKEGGDRKMFTTRLTYNERRQAYDYSFYYARKEHPNLVEKVTKQQPRKKG